MKEKTESILLNLKPNFKEKTYIVLREEHHRFEGISSENFTETNFKVKHIKKLENNINRFKISQHNYKQSNATGMYKWAGDLHLLRENIVLDIDINGHITNVQNHYLIKILWNEYKYELKKKHKKDPYAYDMIKNISHIIDSKENYTNTIKYNYTYAMLFPHIYNKKLSTVDEAKGYRELNSFIGTKDVPIITAEKIKEFTTKGIDIVATGEIDKANFKQNHVSEMIKTLKNRPRVPTQVKLNYTERYLLDTNNSVTQAMCLNLLQVPNTLYRHEKTIVKQLNVL